MLLSPLHTSPLSVGGDAYPITVLDFTGITNYAYFGDSIAFGSNSTAGNSFRELLNTNYATTNSNQAVGGRGVWREMYNANNYTFTKLSSVLWFEGGLNDLRRSDVLATSNKLESSLKTVIAKAFKSSQVAASGSSSVTRVGSFTGYDAQTNGGVYSGGTIGVGSPASFSSTIGNTWTWSFTGNNVFVIFGAGSSTVLRGNCEIRIDGNLVESVTDLSNRWDGVSDGDNDNKRGADTRFFSGLSAGAHSIEVRVTSSTAVAVDQFGVLDAPVNCGVVGVIQIPYVVDYNKVGLDKASDSKIDAANLLRENIVNIFNGLGYRIAYCKIMKGNGGLYDLANIDPTDNVHPLNAGHLQIYQSLIRYIG